MPLNTNPVIGAGVGLYVADYPYNGVLNPTTVANATNLVEIPQILEVTPDGASYGNVLETHVKSPDTFHENGAGWGDGGTIQVRQQYNERNKAFVLSLLPRMYLPPAGAPPANVPIPRGGKSPLGATYTQADAPLNNLDRYLWIIVFPDGSKTAYFGYISESSESNLNTDDNVVESSFTIKTSGRPLFIQVP